MTAATTTPPYAIAVDCDLFDDYLFTDNVIVDTSAANQIAPFAAPDGSGLACLAIVGDETRSLVYVEQTGGVAGGWTVTPIPDVSGVVQVVAATVADGVVAVFQDGSNSYGASLDSASGAWTVTAPMDPFVNDLQVSSNADRSTVYIYGSVSGDNSTQPIRLLTWNSASGSFDQSDMSAANTAVWGFIEGAEVQYLLVQAPAAVQYSGAGYTVFLVANGGNGAEGDHIGLRCAGCLISDGVFAPSIPGLAPGPAEDIDILHGSVLAENSVQVLYRDADDQQVYVMDDLYASNYDDSTPTGFSYRQATVRGGDEATIYGVAADGTLTSLHQDGVDENNMPTWAEPISIAPDLATVVAPSAPTESDVSLMAVNVDGVLTACLVDDVGGWTIQEVATSQSTPVPPIDIATYQIEVQVTDAYGNPAAAVDLGLSAAAATGVNHNGTSVVVGPDDDQQPTLTTDSSGRLMISTFAFSITAQPLTITAPDGTVLSVAPDQPLVDFFTGAESRNGITFSSETLTAATVPGTTTPLAPALQGNQTLSDAAAGGIGMIMALHGAPADATSVPDPATGKPVYGYTLDVSDPSAPKFAAQTDPDSVAAARAERSDKMLLGGFFHDVDKWAHDVWHGIKSGVATVDQWAVDIEKRTVSFFATVADDVTGWVELAIDGAEAIGSVAHSIFHAIGAVVEDVIDWVKALFEWDDIIDTKKALEYYLNGVLPALADTIDTIDTKLSTWSFADQEQKVKDALTKRSSSLKDTTLTDLTNTGQNTKQSAAATGGATEAAPRLGSSNPANAPTADSFTKGPQKTWLLNKMVGAVGSAGLGDFTADVGDDLTGLLSTFEDTWSDLETQITSFASSILDLAKSDPRDVFEQGVADFLELVVDLIGDLLTVADGIARALLGLAKALLRVAGDLWTQSLDSLPLVGPLLSAIEEVTGADFGDVSLGGVVSLVLAIPVTIAYKLANDGKAPFPQPPSSSVPARTTAVSAESDPVDEQALAFANTGALALSTLIGTGSDLIPADTPVPQFVKYLFLAPGVMSKGLTWPEYDFAPIDLKSVDDWVATAAWGYGMIGLVKGIAEASVPATLIEQFEDPVLLGFDSAIGVGALLVGLVSLDFVDSPSPIAVALKIIDPLPEIVTFVKSNVFTSEVVGLNIAVKVAVDIIAGFASVALTGLEAVEA